VPPPRCASSVAGSEATAAAGSPPPAGGGPLGLPPLADAVAALRAVLSGALLLVAFLVCVGAVQSAWPTVSCSCAACLHPSTE
jgi:hypothetical protein